RRRRLKPFLAIAHRKEARAISAAKEEIGIAILIYVAGCRAGPMPLNTEAHIAGYVPKSPVALITEKFWRLSIINYEEVNVAAIIEIRWHYGYRMSKPV